MHNHVDVLGRAMLVVATAALGACAQQSSQVYDLPIQEVRLSLKQLSMPMWVFGSTPLDFRVESRGPDTVVGIVGKGRDALMQYVITLAPVNERATRVRIELIGSKTGSFGDVQAKLAQNQTIARLYTVAMDEGVASTLLKRPVDMARITAVMTAATAANIGRMQANLDQVHAAEQKRASDTIAKAYAEEAAGTHARR